MDGPGRRAAQPAAARQSVAAIAVGAGFNCPQPRRRLESRPGDGIGIRSEATVVKQRSARRVRAYGRWHWHWRWPAAPRPRSVWARSRSSRSSASRCWPKSRSSPTTRPSWSSCRRGWPRRKSSPASAWSRRRASSPTCSSRSALDAAGRPVIRVTSDAAGQRVAADLPGRGRLGPGPAGARVFGAAGHAAHGLGTAAADRSRRPWSPPPNTIERPPKPDAVAAAPPKPQPDRRRRAGRKPRRRRRSQRPTPTPRADADAGARRAGTDARSAAPTSAGGDLRRRILGPVSGDTSSQIAGRPAGEGYTLDQTMIALLRANPDAFIGGNINQLKAGAVLRVPARRGAGQRRRGAGDARWCASQIAAMARCAPSGAAAGSSMASPGPRPATPPAAPAPRRHRQRSTQSPMRDWKSSRRRQQRDRRREHNPASMPEARARCCDRNCNRPRKRLAARDAEAAGTQGARRRAGDSCSSKQQQLIAMKDSELAAAQQRLAQSNQRRRSSRPGLRRLPWLIGGGALLLAAGRRLAVAPSCRPSRCSASPLQADAAPRAFDCRLVRRVPPSMRRHAPAPAASDGETVAERRRGRSATCSMTAAAAPAVPVLEAAMARSRRACAARVQGAGVARGRRHQGPASNRRWRRNPARSASNWRAPTSTSATATPPGSLLSEVVINGDLAARQRASRLLHELD